MTDKDKYRLLCDSEKSIPIFSRDWWLDSVCGKDKWNVLLIEKKGRVLAALPLYIPCTDIISMPHYTQTMGPWFAAEPNDTKYTTLLGKRQEFCKLFISQIQKYRIFHQHFNYEITDWLPFHWAGYKQTTRYTYLLQDLYDSARIWGNMRPNIRRNIQKATERHHITVQRGIPANDFIDVYNDTFRRQKKATPPAIAVLKSLIKVCQERNQGDLWGGYDKEGRIHAAVFIVWQENSAWYLAGGGNPDLRDSGAHSLVLWEAIRSMSEICDRFDFEGSMLPNIERFFREFGAIQTPFFEIYKGKRNFLDRIRIRLNK